MKKLGWICACAALLMLSGCAEQARRNEELRARIDATTPRCAGAQCDLMWGAARTYVLKVAGYKMQTYSSDFIETYNAVGGSLELAARVNKEPQPDGSYRIKALFWCDNIFGCTRPPADVLLEFNDYVGKFAGVQ